MKNARDHPANIGRGLAAGVGWQMWLKFLKLLVREPKQMATHDHALPGMVKHDATLKTTKLEVDPKR